MCEYCHECVWIINNLNQEYDELYIKYNKEKKENEELKNIINEDINLKDKEIFTDFNYNTFPYR